MSFPINCPDICGSVGGLVCGLNHHPKKGRTVTVPLICNPSTGQSWALPRVKTKRKEVMSFFVYEHSKLVLCMTLIILKSTSSNNGNRKEYLLENDQM